MNQAIQHYFRQARDHQKSIMNSGGGMITTDPDGKASQLSYASAPYGEHAISAYFGAIGQIAFRARLKKRVAEDKRRSLAAKKGWKTRRTNH